MRPPSFLAHSHDAVSIKGLLRPVEESSQTSDVNSNDDQHKTTFKEQLAVHNNPDEETTPTLLLTNTPKIEKTPEPLHIPHLVPQLETLESVPLLTHLPKTVPTSVPQETYPENNLNIPLTGEPMDAPVEKIGETINAPSEPTFPDIPLLPFVLGTVIIPQIIEKEPTQVTPQGEQQQSLLQKNITPLPLPLPLPVEVKQEKTSTTSLPIKDDVIFKNDTPLPDALKILPVESRLNITATTVTPSSNPFQAPEIAMEVPLPQKEITESSSIPDISKDEKDTLPIPSGDDSIATNDIIPTQGRINTVAQPHSSPQNRPQTAIVENTNLILAQSFQEALSLKNSHFDIQLQPEGMGAVHIQIHFDRKAVSADFKVDATVLPQFLENKQEIQEIFSSHGFSADQNNLTFAEHNSPHQSFDEKRQEHDFLTDKRPSSSPMPDFPPVERSAYTPLTNTHGTYAFHV